MPENSSALLTLHAGLTIVSPRISADGWAFAKVDAYPGADDDPHEASAHLKDLYFKADPHFAGRFTVPVLWDTREGTIVNNESADIIRMFNTAFNGLLPQNYAELDLYPAPLRTEIDALNEWVYDTVNSSVVERRLPEISADLACQTAFTRQALQSRRKPTRMPCSHFSRRWTGWRSSSRATTTLSAARSQRLMSGSS